MNKLAKPEIGWLRTNQIAQTHQGEVDGGWGWSSQFLNIF